MKGARVVKQRALPSTLWSMGLAGALAAAAVGLWMIFGAGRTVAEVPPAPPASVTAPAEALGKAFAAVAARVKPAVVSVYSERLVRVQRPEIPFPFGDDFLRQFFGQGLPQLQPGAGSGAERIPERGMGSGMILDAAGHILTNYHVVRGVNKIQVRLADQRQFSAEIVGADPRTDVAVLRIKGELPATLPVVTLGDSDALTDGDLVLAIGAPFGLTQTVTNGIISAKGRSNVGIADYEDFLQTDAAINPGNSGGPLINMRGEVIGMNSAIATGGAMLNGQGQFGGVGFAIPVNMIKAMLPTLIKGGHIRRGMLGVVVQDLTPDLAKAFAVGSARGALISQVNPESDAAKAGLKSGDVIVHFNGKEVTSSADLRNLVGEAEPGSKVSVEVYRGGKRQSFEVTLGELSAATAATAPTPGSANRLTQLGLTVETLTPQLAEHYGLQGDRGALITGVAQGSVASFVGLQPGDLIVEADHQAIRDANELENAVAKAKEQILLLIKRKNASIYVVLQAK